MSIFLALKSDACSGAGKPKPPASTPAKPKRPASTPATKPKPSTCLLPPCSDDAAKPKPSEPNYDDYY